MPSHENIPADTDSAIHTFTGKGYEHYVYWDNDVTPRNELLVFLP
jgi:hypothetical protein